MKIDDLTGMVFGKLTVIERAKDGVSKSGQHRTMWRCKCDCGNPNTVDVAAKFLKEGTTKSCGCLKHRTFNDLTGERFGKLIAIERANDYVEPNGRHRKMWKCKCDCDNSKIIEIREDKLMSGNVESCGCLKRKRITKRNIAPKKRNDYEVQEDYVIIYTSKGEPFLVDLEDFWKVKDLYWFKRKNGYIYGLKDGKQISLSRFIMDCPKGLYVDHKHGSTTIYDNRKYNLRIATPTQNNINRKTNNKFGCAGIYENYCGYYAQITIDGKCIHLGVYKKIDDAIQARKEAEKKYFGEWSHDSSRGTEKYQ